MTGRCTKYNNPAKKMRSSSSHHKIGLAKKSMQASGVEMAAQL